MEKPLSRRAERLLRHLKSTIVTGMIAGLPLAVTVWGLLWLWNLIDGAFAPVLRATVHRNIPGVSFLLLILGVYLIGLLSENVLGRQMLHWGERVVTRLPVARSLYRGTKEVIDTFAQSK